jgi:hypothetical protein
MTEKGKEEIEARRIINNDKNKFLNLRGNEKKNKDGNRNQVNINP